MRALLIIALVVTSLLVAAGFGGTDQPASALQSDHVSGLTSAKRDATKLRLKRSPYGKVLFANGYAMYLFTKDQGSQSKCRGACAQAWPPLRAAEPIKAGKGVKRRLIGASVRADGSEQVTYDGHPLYGYVDDPRGEVFCHDVVEFGGTWYAVRKSGKLAGS